MDHPISIASYSENFFRLYHNFYEAYTRKDWETTHSVQDDMQAGLLQCIRADIINIETAQAFATMILGLPESGWKAYA